MLWVHLPLDPNLTAMTTLGPPNADVEGPVLSDKGLTSDSVQLGHNPTSPLLPVWVRVLLLSRIQDGQHKHQVRNSPVFLHERQLSYFVTLSYLAFFGLPAIAFELLQVFVPDLLFT